MESPSSVNILKAVTLTGCCFLHSRVEWAVSGGTARPEQPVEEYEQAQVSLPQFKNQFNIDGPRWGPYQILS